MKERDRSERHEPLATWESRLDSSGFIPALPAGVVATLSNPLVRLNERDWHIGLSIEGRPLLA